MFLIGYARTSHKLYNHTCGWLGGHGLVDGTFEMIMFVPVLEQHRYLRLPSIAIIYCANYIARRDLPGSALEH